MASRRVEHAHAPSRAHPSVPHAARALSAEHPNVARVRAHASARGLELAVRRFSATTRTAEEAAREIGTGVERIVKSLVFMAPDPTVVLCSGRSRVDEARLAAFLGVGGVRRATADEAKAFTGYAIGGVPPFGHARACRVIADEGLLAYDVVWAAAGLPDAVFPIAPRDLVRIAGAEVAAVSR